MEAEEERPSKTCSSRSPPNPDRQLPNRLPETPETLRPDKTDESMTTEGSRTDDASETSAAHCPGRTPPSLADDEGNTTQLLALAFAGIMLLPFSIGGVFGAYLAGGFVAGSETEPLIEWARVAFVYGWIFVVGFGGYRAYAVALRPDNLDGLLTAVSHRDLISGLLLTELALWSAFFLTVGSAASVAFAVGAGSLLTIPALLLTLCLLLATGISRLHHRTRGAKRRRSIAAAQPPSNAVSRPARYRVLRADLHERVCVSPGTDLSSALADADRLVRGSRRTGARCWGVTVQSDRRGGVHRRVRRCSGRVPVPTFRVALVR